MCTLRGAGIVIFAFASPEQLAKAVSDARQVENYSAKGTNWLAVPTQDTSPAAEQSAAQDIAEALGGVLVPGR